MVKRIEAKIRDAESELALLRDQQKQQSSATASVDVIEERIGPAMGWIDQLEDLVDTDYDPNAVLEAVREFITEIRVDMERKPIREGGRKHVCTLLGGTIHVRPSGLSIPFTELLSLGCMI